MDNMTAKVSCFARAYHHKQNTIHIFDDSVAAAILMDDYDEIAMNMTAGVNFFMPDFKGTKEEGLRLIVDKQLSPSVLARSAYCEGKLLREKEKDCKHLTKEEFNQLLSHISEMLTEGSTLCFDYPFDEESHETKTNRALASCAGEQMKALYSKQEIQFLLEKCGFTMEEHLSHDEMTAAYFAKYNEANPNHPMEAPAGVHYVFARKHI